VYPTRVNISKLPLKLKLYRARHFYLVADSDTPGCEAINGREARRSIRSFFLSDSAVNSAVKAYTVELYPSRLA
jgi:hypothetical protein